MSPAPGFDVTIIETPPTRPALATTGAGFMSAITQRGPSDVALLSRSLDEWVTQYGERVSYGMGYDAAECFFREGGRTLWTSRVVGPDPVNATVELFDASGSASPGDVSLIVTAKHPGDYWNDIDVIVRTNAEDAAIPAGEFLLRLTHATEGIIEESPNLADRAAAVAWAANTSDWIDLAEGASAEDPRAQTGALATGDDDHTNIVEAQWTASYLNFTADLGPGQVFAPGRTTDAAYQALVAHARANRRVALLDGTDTATVATLVADADAAGSIALDARFGGLFAPWAVIPGVLPGTTRTVPWSPIQAGMSARVDAAEGHSNQPVAAENGASRFAVGLSQAAWDEDDRETLDDAGVNVVRNYRGLIQNYGNRTLANIVTDELWSQLSGSREVCAIAFEGGEVMASFVHKQIDGRGRALGRINGRLQQIIARHWDLDALYGATAREAGVVDTDSVNTPEQLQAGEVRAAVGIRTSPGADHLSLELVRRPITEVL